MRLITLVKSYIERYPKLSKICHKIVWKLYIFSDYLNTFVFKAKHEVLTPLGFTLISRNYIANRLMLQGTFESDEVDLIKKHLQEADIFVDVGANIGFYTCLARSLSKQVVAFEPQLQNLECLFTNVSKNGWSDTEIFPIGLSHSPGLLTLYGASGPSASLVKGWAGFPERFKKTIPVNKMDNFLSGRFAGKKLLVKIDVEGAEFDVLKGAVETLTRHPRPTWFVEICLNEFHPEKLNPDYAAVFDLFRKHGYETRLANKENTIVTEADIKKWLGDKKTGTGEFNYLFTPKA